MYFEVTREKMFPLAVIVSLLITALGVFVIVNTLSNAVKSTGYYLSRQQSEVLYWLRFKLPRGTLSAYAISQEPSNKPARSIPVLLYHGEGSDTVNIPLPVIVDHMVSLKRAGWRSVSLDDFRAFMKGQKSLPEKSFLLTFDDGRKDSYYPIDPVMRDMGFTGVMYVVSSYSLPLEGKPSSFYLDKNELQYMLDSGRWELQSHGHLDHHNYHVQSTTDLSLPAETVDGHFLSNKFWNEEANRFETDAEFEARIRGDLQMSKDIISETFGIPVYTYAYPFNDFGNETVNFLGAKDILQSVVPSIYEFAMYQTWPANGDTFNYPSPNDFMIKRIEPKGDWSGKDLLQRLESGAPKEVPYTGSNFGIEWVGIWGTVEQKDTYLSLAAEDSTSGATAFLNGSGWWKNYRFDATVNWRAGTSVSLLARNTDDLNYLACAFTNAAVTLEKHAPGGEEIVIARVPYSFRGERVNAHLGISVQGQGATCYVNDDAIVSGTFSSLSAGGIGVEVWDATRGVAHSEVTSINVTPL